MVSLLYRLRQLFLKPNSKIELGLRTVFHRATSSRLHFLWKDAKAWRSYAAIRSRSDPGIEDDHLQGHQKPGVVFLMRVAEGREDSALNTIHSIRALAETKWEFILFVEEGTSSEVITLLAADDDRLILVRDASQFKLATLPASYCIFCEPGDRFYQPLLRMFYRAYEGKPDLAAYYFDCEYLDAETGRVLPLLKPPSIPVDSLLSLNLLSRSFIRKDCLLSANQGDGLKGNLQSWEYDLAFRLVEKPQELLHLPEVLAYQTGLPQPNNPRFWGSVQLNLTRLGLMQAACISTDSQPRISWTKANLRVAIVIPTKDHHRLLRSLLASLAKTAYQNYDVVLVDNGSQDPGTLDYYQTLQDEPHVSIVPYNDPFNYSCAINLGARESDSDLLLFLNDDMAVMHPEWLGELVQWAQHPNIGVVGTKLIRENHTLQHAGIVIGLNEFAGHLYLNAPDHYHGLAGSVDWYRDYMALTGACQMVRRSVFEEVGGYDEEFGLAFGDIDFCLKVYEQGYRNVYTPFACLYHFEGASRGYSTPVDDINRGYSKLRDYLYAPDPYYPERLTYTRIPHYLPGPVSRVERTRLIEERRKFYLKH